MSTDPTGAAAPGIHTGSDSMNAAQGHHHHHDHHQPQSPTDSSSIAVVNPLPDDSTSTFAPASTSKPTGLHSPPDSNNVDGSDDSELSDLDEAIANADDMHLDSPPPQPAKVPDADPAAPGETAQDQPEQVPTPEQDEDIGEVVPDHWSGTVPVFKPPMHQFKDFKKFVCPSTEFRAWPSRILTQASNRWRQSIPTA